MLAEADDDHKNRSKQRTFLTTLAFTICFAVWTIFAIIGVQIKQDMGLNDTQFSLLIGTPILDRLVGQIIFWNLGRPIWWTPHFHGGHAFVCIFYMVPDLCDTYEMMLLTALGVGISGRQFCCWYFLSL
jgi:NNP family nitrate/nitrite transporter-like MFS transporter